PPEPVSMIAFWICAAGLTIAALGLFVWDQGRRGRFRTAPAAAVDGDWIERTLLKVPAEIAGSAWSDTDDRDTVKAILTRLVIEGKIAAEDRGGGPVLTLRVPHGPPTGYEHKLLNAHFVYA